ncbi:unnamed protein product [Coregonus sp. 'balchen']|nr:unnamed protein product [Coregonus sp. 'balchen']
MTLSLLGLMRPALCRSLVALVPMVRSPQLAVISRVQQLLPNTCHGNMVPPAASCVRLYATKKSKAKAAKGQASKVNINSSLVEDIISLEEVKEDMAAVLTTLKDDFSRNLSIRTSPASDQNSSPSGRDATQFTQLAMDQSQRDQGQPVSAVRVLLPQSQLAVIRNRSNAMAAATRALRESSMKLNPEVDGTIIRVKKAKETVSEDTIRLVEKQVGQMADSFAADVDKQLTTKTKELLG